ncbi:hypothetical protein BDW02DRAFT_577552 [Decorospora gaudefroyi]|uniref:C2H2-type domain-containing protein n=1 Tax=Decorospora gaudefroyi TaxID=184978 RepID=A0A6A5KMD2_9PLEO|nr:hypothetical protein BDW02DRAFT_577552 [Decorospora gaudefroyi]
MAPTDQQLTLSLGLLGPLESSSTPSLIAENGSYLNLPNTTASLSNEVEMGDSTESPLFLQRTDATSTYTQSMEPVTYVPSLPPPPVYPIPFIKARRLAKTRLGLPITLHKHGVLATVLAYADTGADVNIMSDDLAKSLGYTNYKTLPAKKQFALANGKIVEAVGQVESTCSFGVETELSVSMTCLFYILSKAATPIIMGLSFLEQTKTMTEHMERLVRVPRPAFQALSVCSIDRPRNLLTCKLDRKEALATPDSGSEVDLISPSFASERGFAIFPEEEAIELADGSRAITTGFVRAEISIVPAESPDSFDSRSIVTVDFFVLDNLAHDLIIGEDSLEELKVFTHHQHALIPAPTGSRLLGINRIRYLGAVDRVFSWIKKKMNGTNPDHDHGQQDGDSSRSHLVEDQRENDRREHEAARITALPIAEQRAAEAAEVVKQRAYDDARMTWGNYTTTQFRCDHDGCSAAPFQTQYLLNLHKNLHTIERPHYCPIAHCPRSKGGKGFKRKKEKIRHSLVHQSPGYVCPFYPASIPRKFPRPDNLQRHVHVHHVDKDRDDPALRAVLSQG